MSIDVLIIRLRRRYAMLPVPKVPKRKRRSALDAYLPEIRNFTLRRLYAADPKQFSLTKLADEITQRSGRSFHKDAIRKTLIRHNLYQLWGGANENS